MNFWSKKHITIAFMKVTSTKEYNVQILSIDHVSVFATTTTLSSWRLYADKHTREGQKFLATILFLFTWVHLYKGGSLYIKYETLSFMLCNMNSVARLVALRH